MQRIAAGALPVWYFLYRIQQFLFFSLLRRALQALL